MIGSFCDRVGAVRVKSRSGAFSCPVRSHLQLHRVCPRVHEGRANLRSHAPGALSPEDAHRSGSGPKTVSNAGRDPDSPGASNASDAEGGPRCPVLANGPVAAEVEDEPEAPGDQERISFRAPVRVAVLWRQVLEISAAASGSDLPEWALAENVCAEYLAGAPLQVEDESASENGEAAVSSRVEACVKTDPGSGENDAFLLHPGDVDREANRRRPWAPLSLLVHLITPPSRETWTLHEEVMQLADWRTRLDACLSRALSAFAMSGGAWQAGFRTTHEYASEALGIGPRQARSFLSLERRLLRLKRAVDACREPSGPGWALPPEDREAALVTLLKGLSSERRMTAHSAETVAEAINPGRGPVGEPFVRISFLAPPAVAAVWRDALARVRASHGGHIQDWEAVEVLIASFLVECVLPERPLSI